MVSCTEEDVTVEFLDYGNEAVLYDSQKVRESLFKYNTKKSSLVAQASRRVGKVTFNGCGGGT